MKSTFQADPFFLKNLRKMIESQLLKILLRRIGVIVVLISIGYFYGNDVSLFLTDSLNFATNFSLIIKISIMFGSNIRR